MSESDRELDAAVTATLRTPPPPSSSSNSNRSSTSAGADANAATGSSTRRQRGKRKRSRGSSNGGSGSTTNQNVTSGDAEASSGALLAPPPAKKKASSSGSSAVQGNAATVPAAASAAATSDATADADGKEADNADDDTDAQWGCPACTFLNDPVRSFCEMCGTTNPAPKRTSRGAGVLGALFAGSPDASAPWSCVACTMSNAPDMRTCAVCGTVNPQASMHSALTISRRSLTGGLVSDAIDVDEMSDSDSDDDDDDDGEDDDHSGDDSDDSDDASESEAVSSAWTCRICTSNASIPASEPACPTCLSTRPSCHKSPLKARRHGGGSRSKRKKTAHKHAAAGKSSKPKKSAYGVSSDVLRKLALEPTSSKLTDTLQTLTHTLAMMDASADSEWGDIRGASLFIRGFGASAAVGASASSGAKDPELLSVLCEVFSQQALAYPVEVRLLAVQAINYLMKMDRHLFSRAVVLKVVDLYLTDLLQWPSGPGAGATTTAVATGSTTTTLGKSNSSSETHRSAQMVVEECLTGMASVCSFESSALRELVRTERFGAYVAFVTRLVASDSGFHVSIVATSLELLQKCCVRMRWSTTAAAAVAADAPAISGTRASADTTKKSKKKPSSVHATTSSPSKSPSKSPAKSPAKSPSKASAIQDGVMTMALAHKVVALLRCTLLHKHVPLRVKAAKCLLLVFRRIPFAQPEAITELVTADVLAGFVAVVTNASGSESEDSRHAMISLLFQLFDNRPQLVSLFVQRQLYCALFDGVLPLLQSTSSALGVGALKLTALLARLVCRKHSTAVAATAVATADSGVHASAPAAGRHRLNSAPDPDVLATLLLDFIRADSIPAVSALLKDGADLNFPRLLDIAGREIDKPLHVAVEHASLAMVKYLVKRGADVHQSGVGGTALHIAAKCGRCDVVSFLLQCGASANAVDRDGKSVLAALASNESSEGEASVLPSPVKRMLQSHKRALHADDDDDDDDMSDVSDAEHDSDHASARTWFFADDDGDGDQDDDGDLDDDDDDEDDDGYFLHDYDDDEDDEDEDDYDHHDEDDDEMPSDEDDNEDDEHEGARREANSEAMSDGESHAEPATSAAKKRRIDSISSETEIESVSVLQQSQIPADSSSSAALRDSAVSRENDAVLRRQGFAATPEEIYGFSHAILRCLLTVLYDMDIQNVERSVISTLACVLEMAPSQLVRSLSDCDVVLVLDMVHFLLQGQKLDQQQQEQDVHSVAFAPPVAKTHEHAPNASSNSSSQLKANLSSYILALRILQAIVRKSAGDSSIFYQIERRGICEQIEHVNAKSVNWLPSSLSSSSMLGSAARASPTPHNTIFTRGLELLETLRANMIESGMLHLHKLKNLARRMREIPESSTGGDHELAVVDLVELFEHPNSITTYEFKQSELLPAVLHFIAPHRRLDETRAKLLLRAFERSPEGLKHLVARLQSIVTHDESFPVVSYNPGRGRELYPLTRQLKISFARVPTTRSGGVAVQRKLESDDGGDDDERDNDNDADADDDETVTSKTIHSSPLTHFQSFERTVARCLPVRDAKLSQLYANLVGHCVQKVLDGKWKKFAVCGYDAKRSFHLLKPVGGTDDDIVEMVLHDSQYKLTGSVAVFANVSVQPELFGAVVCSSSDSGTSNESKKRRKAANKRKRKLSVTKAQGDESEATAALCDVEVHNEGDLDLGTFKGAWYAGSLVADTSSANIDDKAVKPSRPGKFEVLVKPHGSYSVRLAAPGNRVVHNVPASALRKRLAAPQIGSVVEVDGSIGEVTNVYTSERGNAQVVDVKVNCDVEKVRVKKERIRYPPTAATATSGTDGDDRIEAMSIRRMFPPRESSLLAGSVGDRVWISPPTGSPVKDLYVAGTIKSFPSGLESIREASTLHVDVSLGIEQHAAPVTLKVQQDQVVNFVNGSRRGGGSGSSRLLAALQMASNRAGHHDRLFGSNSSGSALHRAFQQATDSMRPSGGGDAGRSDGDGGGAMDQLRQLISRVSRSGGSDMDTRASDAALVADVPRLSAPALVTSSSLQTGSSSGGGTVSDASLEIPRLEDATEALSATTSRASSPVARRPTSQKRPDESARNERVWEHLVHNRKRDGTDDDDEPAWICAAAPRVNLCLAYGGRESGDAQLDLAIANSRLGVGGGGSGAASRYAATSPLDDSKSSSEENKTRSLLFGKPQRASANEVSELTPRVQMILLDVFKSFEPTATRTPSPKKKKRKLSAAAASALASGELRLDDVPDTLWDIDRFCAFMKRSVGWPKPSIRHGVGGGEGCVEQCVLFSKFATVTSNRRGLNFSGFVALMTAFCREPTKAKLVLKHVRSLGYSDAHLAAGSSRAAKKESALALASSVAPASSGASSAPRVRSDDDNDGDDDIATTKLALHEFPADQNVLKCLQVLQQASSAATQPSLPPWKYLYKVQCDYRVDWNADASHTSASAPASASASSSREPCAKKQSRGNNKPQQQPFSDATHLLSGSERSEQTTRDAFEWLDQDARAATTSTLSKTTTTTSVASAVRLLHYLFDLTANGSVGVHDDVWTNPRLYNKLETQLQDVLSVCCGIYPPWCDQLVTQCRFFFPRDLREWFFRATAFGCTRSLYWFRHQLQLDESSVSGSDSVGGIGSGGGNAAGGGISSGGILNHEISITPIPKERVKVHRANILQSAEAVMKLHAKRRAILDIVFAGEKGYGSGVTAAFYSATALALQSVDENARRRLWVAGDEAPASARSDDNMIDSEDAVIRHPNGLFPFPHIKAPVRVLERFRMMGRLAGKAIMDERLLPLPLAPQFMQLVVGESFALGEVAKIFQGPGRILLSMHAAAKQLAAIAAASDNGGTSGASVQIDGMDLETWLDAVSFTFIEPLSQEPLMPHGGNTPVTAANLGEYVDSVLNVWLAQGIDAQVRAFREGISDVLPLEKLKLLFVPELLAMLCGDADITWDAESLRKTLKLAHGYTSASAPVQFFVEFLDEMSLAERRAFLLYATGCPNLPPGGFAALKPTFEVVRRVVETDDVDRALPFARTCTNTLHLPAYSSKDVLTRQMRFAIANSRGVIDRD